MAMVNKHLLNDCLVIKTAAVSFSLTICLSGMRCDNNGSYWVRVLQFLNSREINTDPLSQNVAVSVNQLHVTEVQTRGCLFPTPGALGNIWKTPS